VGLRTSLDAMAKRTSPAPVGNRSPVFQPIEPSRLKQTSRILAGKIWKQTTRGSDIEMGTCLIGKWAAVTSNGSVQAYVTEAKKKTVSIHTRGTISFSGNTANYCTSHVEPINGLIIISLTPRGESLREIFRTATRIFQSSPSH
jgi:hypothetical protein